MSTFVVGGPYPGAVVEDLAGGWFLPEASTASAGRPPRDCIIAMEATPLDPAAPVICVGGPFPGAVPEGDDPATPSFTLYGAETTVRLAQASLLTGGSDAPSNTFIPGRIIDGFNFSVRAFAGVEPEGTNGEAGRGELQVADADGRLNAWLGYAWDGRPLRLLRGRRDQPFREWTKVATLQTNGLIWDAEKKRLGIRDARQLLKATPLLRRTYAGTGGIEGGDDLKGRPVPRCWGEGFVCAPDLIDRAKMIYRFGTGPCRGLLEAANGGVPWLFLRNYATYAELEGAVLPADGGWYATCLAESVFRMSGTPDLKVTCKPQGEVPAGSYDVLPDVNGSAYVDQLEITVADFTGVYAGGWRKAGDNDGGAFDPYFTLAAMVLSNRFTAAQILACVDVCMRLLVAAPRENGATYPAGTKLLHPTSGKLYTVNIPGALAGSAPDDSAVTTPGQFFVDGAATLQWLGGFEAPPEWLPGWWLLRIEADMLMPFMPDSHDSYWGLLAAAVRKAGASAAWLNTASVYPGKTRLQLLEAMGQACLVDGLVNDLPSTFRGGVDYIGGPVAQYLADACEAKAGCDAMAWAYDVVGDGSSAATWRGHAATVRSGIMALWDGVSGRWRYYYGQTDQGSLTGDSSFLVTRFHLWPYLYGLLATQAEIDAYAVPVLAYLEATVPGIWTTGPLALDVFVMSEVYFALRTLSTKAAAVLRARIASRTPDKVTIVDAVLGLEVAPPTPNPEAGYVKTRADIVRRIVSGLVDLDEASFETLNQQQGATVGFWFGDQVSIDDALSEILAGCLGYHVVGPSGRLTVAQLGEPTGDPVVRIDCAQGVAPGSDLSDWPRVEVAAAPRWATRVGYARNYAPMSLGELADINEVTPQQRAPFEEDEQIASREDDWVRSTYRQARDVAVRGNYAEAWAAAAEANRQQQLMRSPRVPILIPTKLDPFADLIGRTVSVENLPLYGWPASKPLTCIGVVADSPEAATLVCWGSP